MKRCDTYLAIISLHPIYDNSNQCNLGDKWNHINCININKQKYRKLKSDPLPEYCPMCKEEMPFSKVSNNEPKCFLNTTT